MDQSDSVDSGLDPSVFGMVAYYIALQIFKETSQAIIWKGETLVGDSKAIEDVGILRQVFVDQLFAANA